MGALRADTVTAMESENVAVVRRVYELFNALDPDPEVRAASAELAELIELFAPGVKFIQPPGALDSTVHHGRREFRQSWDEWLTVWSQQRARIDEIDERGNEVLVTGTNTFRGRDGIELEVNGGGIFTFAEGHIVRLRTFFDADETHRAFEADG